jgi:hypothetical protein
MSAGGVFKGDISGSVSGKKTECTDDSCITSTVGGTVAVAIGAKAIASIGAFDCPDNVEEGTTGCQGIFVAAGEGQIMINVPINISMTGTSLCEQACTSVDASVGALRVSGSLGYNITVLDIIKYSDVYQFNEPMTSGFSIGPFGSCN